MGIAWSHYKFRRAFRAQGHDLSELPFKAPWYPAGPLIALGMCAVVVVGQSLDIIRSDFSFLQFFSIYLGLFLFLGIWIGHKIVTRSPKVHPQDADLSRHA